MNTQVRIRDDCIPLKFSARPGVLIVGGVIGSLAAARSLGRHGIAVWLLTDDSPLPGLSRYVARTLNWNGPQEEKAADELVALAKHHGLEGWVLIPGADKEVRLIAQNHAKLSDTFRLTTPNWDVVQWADDKNLTYQLAARAGLVVPKRYFPKNLDDVRQLDCRFPVILKPASHHATNAFTLAKAWIAEDRNTLIERYRQAADGIDQRDIVLQEMIPGDGRSQFSYAAIWHDGRPLAALVATRSRQYPINVGYTSTFVEVVDNPAVADAATRFLSALKYSGAVEVEFKFDARDGAYKILDVNPRLWAWIGIGEAAGIDFATMLYHTTLGEPLAFTTPSPNAAWMHFSRDLIAAVQEMAKGRLTTKRYFSAYRKALTFAVFSIDDPLPMLVELPITLYRVLTRRAYFALNGWLTRAAGSDR
jgi:predicted ATP-grasp superfamily ATP-dependent carboligase